MASCAALTTDRDHRHAMQPTGAGPGNRSGVSRNRAGARLDGQQPPLRQIAPARFAPLAHPSLTLPRLGPQVPSRLNSASNEVEYARMALNLLDGGMLLKSASELETAEQMVQAALARWAAPLAGCTRLHMNVCTSLRPEGFAPFDLPWQEHHIGIGLEASAWEAHCIGPGLEAVADVSEPLAATIMSLIDNASRRLNGWTPADTVAAVEMLYWMGCESEAEAALEYGEDEFDSEFTRAEIDQMFPEYSRGSGVVRRAQLRAHADHPLVATAARLALDMALCEKAWPFGRVDLHCDDAASNLSIPFVLRWKDSDVSIRILDDAMQDRYESEYGYEGPACYTLVPFNQLSVWLRGNRRAIRYLAALDSLIALLCGTADGEKPNADC